MNFRYRKTIGTLLLLVTLLSAVSVAAVSADGAHKVTYRVTIKNLAGGQPLTPPIAATHRWGFHMFQKGALASSQLEYIAEDGMNGPMSDLLNGSAQVTDVFVAGAPLTPRGTTVGDFTDTMSFEITARPGDRLSLTSMLICTNDGFTGLDSVRLPKFGARAFLAKGYDAGTEDNTEMSKDLVDPCSALGPFPLDGDPNGNEDAAVDTTPQMSIQRHPGITGLNDLSRFEHGWIGPVALVIVSRVD